MWSAGVLLHKLVRTCHRSLSEERWHKNSDWWCACVSCVIVLMVMLMTVMQLHNEVEKQSQEAKYRCASSSSFTDH
jgi:hypothetical protein